MHLLMTEQQIKARIDKLQHEVAFLRGLRETQPKRTTKDFYCSTCLLQLYEVQCKPEDGAITGYCPKCDEQKVFIHGYPPKQEQQSCAGHCGCSDNLTEVTATPEGTYLLCPVCLADEEME